MERLPRIFVGSSVEGLEVAQALRGLLATRASVMLWNEGFFQQNQGYLETLVKSVSLFDFAIIVASPDDTVVSRGSRQLGPRDNTLFELGLFMGHLGRDKTFLVTPRNMSIKIPSDFSGIEIGSFDWPTADGGEPDVGSRRLRMMTALGPVADSIRDVLSQWAEQQSLKSTSDPGVIRCYTVSSEAHAAISRAILGARQRIWFTAVNFSYTVNLNVAELQAKIEDGVAIRFLVLNPHSAYVATTAREFLISEAQLNDENRLYMKTMVDLVHYSEAASQRNPSAGPVEIRLYDAPLRMRSYAFDGEDSNSFFVPYVNRMDSPLPVFQCQNSGAVARRYLSGIESLWSAPDTMLAKSFLEANPRFLGSV